MAIELGGIALNKISRITTREQAGFVRHRPPGMEGELTQHLGRAAIINNFSIGHKRDFIRKL